MPKITIQLDNYPDGAELDTPVGRFKNRGTYDVDDVRWQIYVNHVGEENVPEDEHLVLSTQEVLEEAEARAEAHEVAADPDATKEELEEAAKKAEIKGRSRMKKAELREELEEA